MLDMLAVGAHPDDVDLTIGGLVARMTRMGKKVGILDLTRGEMGSRGTPESRESEAKAAAEILGVESRQNLDLGDGQLLPSLESRRRVIEVIRRERPEIVVAPYWEDLHPDHAHAGQIVLESFYPSGFVHYPAEGEAYRPRGMLFFQSHFRFDPSFVVDTTETFEAKMEAVRCFASQLHQEGIDGPKTNISHPEFLQRIEARDRHYGALIGKKFGEPIFSPRVLRIDNPLEHF